MFKNTSLKELMENLNFSENNSLAVNYLDKPRLKIEPIGFQQNASKVCHDNYGNTIHYFINDLAFEHAEPVGEAESFRIASNLQKLATLIEENVELIAHLEKVIRSFNVVYADIYIIIKALNNDWTHFRDPKAAVLIKSETPLGLLGYVACGLLHFKQFRIICDKQAAVVCHMFATLCHTAGLTGVQLQIVEDASDPKYDVFDELTIYSGCVGVVTEYADMDSAADCFLGVDIKYPWKLTHVFVQENVYNKFKKALQGKSSLTNSVEAKKLKENTSIDLSTAVFYGGLIFLFDYVGSCDDLDSLGQHVILVEGYRTTKEVLSLIHKYTTYAVSLWSNDLSTANELSLSVKAPIVWINNYAQIEGPNDPLTLFYPRNDFPIPINCTKTEYNEIIKKETQWKNYDFQKRRQILLNYIGEILSHNNDKNVLEFYNNLRKVVLNYNNSNVIVNKKTMCLTIPLPLRIILKISDNTCYEIATLLDGSTIFIYPNVERAEPVALLQNKDIPLMLWSESNKGKENIEARTILQKIKCVWTPTSTIFAN